MTSQSHPHHPTTQVHHQPQDNGLAIASLILGIVSLVGFGALAGIPAVITGFLSLKNPVNKGLGIAGLVMGAISTIFTLFLIIFFIFVLILAATSSAPSHPGAQNDSMYDSSYSHSI